MTAPLKHPRFAYELWKYVEGGSVVHHLASSVSAVATCGLWRPGSHVWRGTGTQEEYETVAILPECKNCLKNLKRI